MARIPIDLARKPVASNAQDPLVSSNRGQGAIRAQAEGQQALLEGLNAVGRGTRQAGEAILKREQTVDRMNLEAKSMEITRQFRQYLQQAQGDQEIKMLEENAVANFRAWITGEDDETGERNVRSAGVRRDVTPRVKLFGETLSVLGDRRRVALQKARGRHGAENVRRELYKSVEWMPGKGLRTLIDLRDAMRSLGDFYRGQLGLSAEEANTWTISSVRELEKQTASAGLSAIERGNFEEDELKKRIKTFCAEIDDSDSFTELTTVERDELRKRAGALETSILKTREVERKQKNAAYIKQMSALLLAEQRRDPGDRMTKQEQISSIAEAKKEGIFDDDPVAEQSLLNLVEDSFAARTEALREREMEQVRGRVRSLEVALATGELSSREVVHALVGFKTKLTGDEWDEEIVPLFNKALGEVDKRTEKWKRHADDFVAGLRKDQALGPLGMDEDTREKYDKKFKSHWWEDEEDRLDSVEEAMLLLQPGVRAKIAYDSLQAEIYKFIEEANRVEIEGGDTDKPLNRTTIEEVMHIKLQEALRRRAINEGLQ